MPYEMTGSVIRVMDTQTFPSGFSKREFVIQTDEKYPQQIKLECIKERCSLLEGIRENDEVEVRFVVRGNEHDGRFYVNLQALEITRNNPF